MPVPMWGSWITFTPSGSSVWATYWSRGSDIESPVTSTVDSF